MSEIVDLTNRVHALVAPSVWGTEVALALNCLATATIVCLVITVTARAPDPLDVSTIVIMWHAARAVPVVDISKVVVAPDAVEEGRRGECDEKRGKGGEGVGWRLWDVVEHVCVEGLWRDGGDERVQGFGGRWHCRFLGSRRDHRGIWVRAEPVECRFGRGGRAKLLGF